MLVGVAMDNNNNELMEGCSSGGVGVVLWILIETFAGTKK